VKPLFQAIDPSYHRSTRALHSVAGSVVIAAALAAAAYAGWLPIAPTPFMTLMGAFTAAVLLSTWVYYRRGFDAPLYGFMNVVESSVLFVGLAVTIVYSPTGHPLLWAFYIIMSVMQAPSTGPSAAGILSATAPAAVVAVLAYFTQVAGEPWQLALSASAISGTLYWYVGRTRELSLEKLAQAQEAERTLAVAQAQLELKDKLILADKMAALGVLTAGVAHEISNPLTYILGNIEHLLTRRDLDETVRQPLVDVQSGFHQIERIVGEMRTFSHWRPAPTPEVFDLRDVCSRTERMMAAELRYAAHVTFELPPAPVPVCGSPERIQQILLNLLINARQALPPRPAAENRIAVTLRTGTAAVLEVADNGAGMDQDTLRRVFDPFFTTKEPGTGTGLGLSVSYQIAADHGGGIDVRSQPGAGTVFTLTLPVHTAEQEPNHATLRNKIASAV
jgi:signal transduction histidine kinase